MQVLPVQSWSEFTICWHVVSSIVVTWCQRGCCCQWHSIWC